MCKGRTVGIIRVLKIIKKIALIKFYYKIPIRSSGIEYRTKDNTELGDLRGYFQVLV